jgi:glycosyltransferase involved in cell wall biosynthesis
MDITLSSLKSQTVENFEVLIADNASTDDSVEVIKKYEKNGLSIQFIINPTNIGFAGNLDKVGLLAKAPWMIMLSSDDVVNKNALETYSKFISINGDNKNYAFCATFEKIDSEGKFLEFLSPAQSSIWHKSDIDTQLTQQMGFDVYKVKAAEMLNRCLTRFLNPFNFASTCYPQEVYEKVGGYGGGRLYNPDKWFHWKIMAELEDVYYLDNPLFQYRWHNNNQANKQKQNRVLKYWMDEYRNSFEVTDKMLLKANFSANEIIQAYIDRCIIPYSYRNLKEGNYDLAARILNFGCSSYPESAKKNRYYTILKLSLSSKISSILTHHIIKCFTTKE